MEETLLEQFVPQNLRNDDLRRLMHICRTEAQLLSVVCVGAGDAFINRYWPTLEMQANRGRLKLTVADQCALDSLGASKSTDPKPQGLQARLDRLRKSYDSFAARASANAGVKYLDLNSEDDQSWYHHLTADIVFILVPDEIHVSKAREWVKRSTLVIVEKPYNRDLEEAQEFEREMKEVMDRAGGDVPATWVIPFDHYLGKIFDYDVHKKTDGLFERIGPLQSVKFRVVECEPLEPWRVDSLRAGMAYDLFSHVLAMLSVELKVSTLTSARIKAKVARHQGCPDTFSAETFAAFSLEMEDFRGRLVPVQGSVGKGVGSKDEKCISLQCAHGVIHFDLDPKGAPRVYREDNGKPRVPIYGIGNGHREMLEALLSGEFARKPIGGLTGDAAIAILRILNAFHDRVRGLKIPEYPIGESAESIVERALSVTGRGTW